MVIRGLSRSTVYRVLVRHRLIQPVPRRRRRDQYIRWERWAPMQLWQLDVTASLFLASGCECKVITGIDDHSRYRVIATVVYRATGRAVCSAFVEAMRVYGVPAEVLSDNGKQFTGRFGKPRPAEVLFERICRENGITQRLTRPRSPTTTGKIERLHQTLQLGLLNEHEPFASIEDAQAAVDAWRTDYNADRPPQSLGMAFPSARFVPAPTEPLELRVPSELASMAGSARSGSGQRPQPPAATEPAPAASPTGAVELDRVVPPSGNLWVAGQQIWLGPAMTGRVIRIWADTQRVHARHRLRGARAAVVGPPRLPEPLQVKRRVSVRGAIMIGGQRIQAGLPHAGKTAQVTVETDTYHITVEPGITITAPRTTSRDIRRHKASSYQPPAT